MTELARPVRDRRRLHETDVELEVPFHDVDPMRIVWHGHYYKYFELARTKLLRGVGLDAGGLIGKEYELIVTESRCRYVLPLRYADRFRVSAWFRDTSNRLCIDYEITLAESGERATRGRTVIATLDSTGRLMMATPQPILDQIHG
jgi:acyl-CoA thioester hydrolase